MTSISDLINLDIRVGTIIQAEVFAEANPPAYKLKIDFGDYGVKQSSAQLTRRYDEKSLTGRKIVAALGLPPKFIAGFKSECLVLGAVDGLGDVILLDPGKDTPDGYVVR